MTTTQDALQISAIVPILTVDDPQKSLAFYEALGFTVDERWEDNGQLLGVMLRAGKNQIGLSQDDWKKGRDRKKGIGVRLFCRRRRTSTRSRREPRARASSSSRSRTTPSGRAGLRGHRSERLPADDLVGISA